MAVAPPPGTVSARPRAGRCTLCGRPVGWQRVGGHRLLVCSGCGLGRLAAGLRTEDYWDRRHDLDGELSEPYWTTARTAVFTAALDRLAAEVKGRRLVDIGGGVGHFAACARDRGWDAYSLDVSPTATAAAADRLGRDRALCCLPPELVGACDAVTLWCVVAHVSDARPLLAEAARALAPGGRVLVTTPNFRFQKSYARALHLGGRSLDFVAHDHLAHFTPASLGLALAQAGLLVERFAYLGVTEDCLLDRRWAGPLVPAKRAWNWSAVQLARAGLPLLSSELQVLAVRATAAT